MWGEVAHAASPCRSSPNEAWYVHCVGHRMLARDPSDPPGIKNMKRRFLFVIYLTILAVVAGTAAAHAQRGLTLTPPSSNSPSNPSPGLPSSQADFVVAQKQQPSV